MTIRRCYIVGVVVVIGALASLVPVPAAGQSLASATEAGPRTPWGDPDLQGVWDYWTFTPLERPEEFAGKVELTDEEAALVAQQGRAAALVTDREGPGPGSTGAYGQEVWTERGRATALTQSSLLVDPPDGRMPSLTPAETSRVSAHGAAGDARSGRARPASARMARKIAAWPSGASWDSARGHPCCPPATTTMCRSSRHRGTSCLPSR